MQKILAISTAALFCGGCYFNVDKIDKLYAEKDELQKQCFELQADLKIKEFKNKQLSEVNDALSQNLENCQDGIEDLRKQLNSTIADAKELYDVVYIVEKGYSRNYGRFNDEIVGKYLDKVMPQKPFTRTEMLNFLGKISILPIDYNSMAYGKIVDFIRENKPEYIELYLQQQNNNILSNVLINILTAEDKPLLKKHILSENNFNYTHVFSRFAEDSDKKFVLENLNNHPELITIVSKMNWSKEAKDIIIGKLENASGNTFNYYQQFLSEAVKLLPPEQSKVLIAEFWENIFNNLKIDNNAWSIADNAMFFARLGHVPAYCALIKYYNNYSNDQYRVNQFMILSPIRDIDELTDALKNNPKAFTYDATSKKFVFTQAK